MKRGGWVDPGAVVALSFAPGFVLVPETIRRLYSLDPEVDAAIELL